MNPKTMCEAHSELTAELAREAQARRDLERERDESTAAILRLEGRVTEGFRALDQRMVAVKITMAKAVGALAAIATIPLIVQLAVYLIRVAQAAQ